MMRLLLLLILVLQEILILMLMLYQQIEIKTATSNTIVQPPREMQPPTRVTRPLLLLQLGA